MSITVFLVLALASGAIWGFLGFPGRHAKPAPMPPIQAPAPKGPTSLAITQVLREGPPPYDHGQRLYKLEGEGVEHLVLGDIVHLRREQEDLALARLQVAVVMPGYALAVVATEGETFPLVGDLAWGRGMAAPLPEMPDLAVLPEPAALHPHTPALRPPGTVGGFTATREKLFFQPGESQLSPAGLAKLKTWVKAWGPEHRYFLAIPPWPGEKPELNAARAGVLKEALKGLGVAEVEVRALPDPEPGKYPLIYVGADPW